SGWKRYDTASPLRPHRLRPLAQHREILIVREHPVALAAGDLPHDAERGKDVDGARRGLERYTCAIAEVLQGGEGPGAEHVEHTQSVGGAPAQAPDPLGIGTEEVEQAVGRPHRACGSLADALQEEIEPRLPVAFGADGVQQAVVLRAVLLEVETQVEERLPQHAVVVQHQSDQEAPDASVPVQEGVDRLELDVSECRPDERRVLPPVVQKPLEVGHAVRDVMRRRRHELGVPGTSATDPNLAGPELSGPLFGTATLSEQNSMDLANQAVRERESLTQAGQ